MNKEEWAHFSIKSGFIKVQGSIYHTDTNSSAKLDNFKCKKKTFVML